jgi:hypothetical protein
MKDHPKWSELLALAQAASTEDIAAGSTASASNQPADSPPAAAGSEAGAEAAVAEREPGGAGTTGAEPDGAGASQAIGDGAQPAEPAADPRRSARSSVAPVRFTDSNHAAWSEYDTARAGLRHAQVREATYDELQESLASTEGAVRSFLSDMSEYCKAAAGNAAEHIAIAHIPYVLLQVMGGEDAADLVFPADTDVLQPEAARSRGTASAGTAESGSRGADPADSSDTDAEEEEGEGEAEIDETWLSALAGLPEADRPRWMRSVLVSGAACTAVLHRGELLLGDTVGLEPTARHALRVAKIKIEAQYRASPFAAPMTRVLLTLKDGTTAQFGVAHGAGGLGDFEEVYTSEAAFVPPSEQPTAEPSATAAMDDPPPKGTRRKQEGARLRTELVAIARLFTAHKSKDAQARLERLLAEGPSEQQAIAREQGLAKQRVRGVRDSLFELGNITLTKRVLRRFLATPEVRLLLPGELRQRQRVAADDAVREELVEAARRFFGNHFKTRGGRSEEDRNAVAAAGAAFLPSGLFEAKHGRAAQRLLGIGYRAAKRFVGIRAEIEERGGGWKRLKMSEHCDKVDYSVMSRAWHSGEFSDPDNQNKQTVRIDLGLGADGERLYDVHERRAMAGTARDLFHVFQKSPFAEELRKATATNKRPRGIKITYDAWCKAKCQCIKKRKPGCEPRSRERPPAASPQVARLGRYAWLSLIGTPCFSTHLPTCP